MRDKTKILVTPSRVKPGEVTVTIDSVINGKRVVKSARGKGADIAFAMAAAAAEDAHGVKRGTLAPVDPPTPPQGK